MYSCVLLISVILMVTAAPGCLDRAMSRRTLIAYNVLYETPANRGMAYENVYLDKTNGERLHGWWVPCEQARGTLFMCHGNLVNMSHVQDYVELFHGAHCNVFIFDYQGFATSTGKLSIHELWNDAVIAMKYVRSIPDVDPRHIIVHGYSLGSPIALAITAEYPDIAAVIVEGLISPRQQLNRELGFSSPVMLPLVESWVLPPNWEPPKIVQKLGERPILVLKRGTDLLGADDEIVLQAEPSHLRFVEFPGASHVAFLCRHAEFRAQLLHFLDDVYAERPGVHAELENIIQDGHYETHVRLMGDVNFAAPQPATFYCFEKNRVCAEFRTVLQPGQRDYVLALPNQFDGHTTDDATARFDLSGEFPGWQLHRRQLDLPAAVAAAEVSYQFISDKDAIQRKRKELRSYCPEKVTVALQYTPVTMHEPQQHLTGTILVDDPTSTTEPQDFLANRWIEAAWEPELRYQNIIQGELAWEEPPSRDALLQQMEKEEGDDWLFALLHLAQWDGYWPRDPVRGTLTAEYGVEVKADALQNLEVAELLQAGLQIKEEAVQRRVQKTLRQMYPDAKFLPSASGSPWPATARTELRGWLKTQQENLYWSFKDGRYHRVEDQQPDYNFLDDVSFEIQFDVDPNQRNVVSMGFARVRRWGHERRVVKLKLDDPVRAMYAAMTDDVLQHIEAAFPGRRAEFLACVAAKLGVGTAGPLTLEAAREWFALHCRALVYHEELRIFELKEPAAGSAGAAK